MEKTKMQSKNIPLGATPDKSQKGCCCGSSSKTQEANVAARSIDAPAVVRVDHDTGTKTGGCCGAS
ncbi:hypothetical protein IMCC20628_04800 (plasmid) [Hoeflea sp. IMCC20628]|uniref:hypothetical protein n=1 Tax=Hoeflea sp. IMCC20628 TaxID=1620421 RepID=UPI00063BE292|nr:hypothetical protein [Hoeflea sp. IMCC20628]AKI03466.1 hypothetical protein IMCC20628_04800 [Hoeflea sp. IMCC20628]